MADLIHNSLPPELESIVLDRFDQLVAKGEIKYEPPRIDIVDHGRFQVWHFHYVYRNI